MSANGKKEIELIKVTLKDGALNTQINTDINMAMVSHALQVIEIQWKEIISKSNKPTSSVIDMPKNIIERFRR